MSGVPSVVERHRRALAGFDAIVDVAVDTPGAWDQPSPCDGWKARDVVEHVTGIHTRLATELGETVTGPKPAEADEIAGRWRAARDAALHALSHPDALDHLVSMPVGEMPAGRFLNILTTDALVHTWDLARAIGADTHLDAELVERAHKAAIPMDEMLRGGTAFGPKVEVGDDADAQSQMLAFFGRDPR
jgi:uncharacterized protein (TIGR03086 family)